MPHHKKGRFWETTLDNSSIDRKARETLWPVATDRDDAETEARWEKVRALPRNEILAVVISTRLNPINTSLRLNPRFAAVMARHGRVSHRSRRIELARRARARLAKSG
jgi:hypothetical protein